MPLMRTFDMSCLSCNGGATIVHPDKILEYTAHRLAAAPRTQASRNPAHSRQLYMTHTHSSPSQHLPLDLVALHVATFSAYNPQMLTPSPGTHAKTMSTHRCVSYSHAIPSGEMPPYRAMMAAV